MAKTPRRVRKGTAAEVSKAMAALKEGKAVLQSDLKAIIDYQQGVIAGQRATIRLLKAETDMLRRLNETVVGRLS